MGRALPFWAGERLLVLGFRLEAVSDGEVPFDQSADLLDRQVGVLGQVVQNFLERLKGRDRIQKGFHKLLLLLSWDAYLRLTGSPYYTHVLCRYLNSECAERLPKDFVTELLHDGSYTSRVAHAFDGQKLVQLGKKQVGCDAPVPATVLTYWYVCFFDDLTDFCFS